MFILQNFYPNVSMITKIIVYIIIHLYTAISTFTDYVKVYA